MTETAYRYVQIDDAGVPIVQGTGATVVEIALLRLAYGWEADQIQRQQPHLTLAQVHSALAYYYDHQDELDRDIDRRRRAADEFFARQGPSPARAKLLAARRAQQ
jgi:uncharacterized protein (DUF433 family)